MKSKKTFDCVEMKRRAQEKIYEEIKGMSPAEELAYWKKHERELKKGPVKAKAPGRHKPKAIPA